VIFDQKWFVASGDIKSRSSSWG